MAHTPTNRTDHRVAVAVVAGLLVAAALIAWMALEGRHLPDDGQAVVAARPTPPPAGRAPLPANPARLPAAAERRIRALPEALADKTAVTPRAAEPTPAAAAEAEEEVIDNAPGRQFPQGIGAAEYIQKLRDMGETEGIAAFPPPGTDPPKVGVIVPDDYELPEGYERYYQVTDDGQPLEPILRFSPDYEFLDERGEPMPLPEDRVVPADRVPADLPVRLLDPENPPPAGGLVGADR